MMEVGAYLLMLPLVLPVVDMGFDLVLRPVPSQVSTTTSLQLDRISDGLREDLKRQPSWLDGDALVIGGERWANDSDGVTQSGRMVLRGGQMETAVDDEGWLTLTLTAANGSTRHIVAGARRVDE